MDFEQVNEVKDTLKKKATETKEKLTTVSETITTKREKKEEKTEKKSSSKHYEFGGPVGAFLLTLLLPAIIIVVNIACTKVHSLVDVLRQFIALCTFCSQYK